jgi:transcriptional regulator with XRE-family HTH domain
MARKKTFFARRLKELRQEAGLSQAELAKECGLGLSTIRQFEQGWREPTFGTLVKLVQGLGVTLAAFEEGKGDEPKKPSRSRNK